MRWAEGEPGNLEREILERDEIGPETLKKAGLEGSRRPARIFLDTLEVTPHPQGLTFRFSLPKGSYATTVLREFMKLDPFLPEE